jgi:NADH dehydrogenase
MAQKNNIVIFGGTGFYGRKVVEKLRLKNCSVRVVTRNAQKAKSLFKEGVELFEGDVTNNLTIVDALKNMDTIIICLSAMKANLIRKMKQIECDAVLVIIHEAEKAKISRLVYMSGYEMREELLEELKIPEFGAIKIEIENAIRKTKLNWTILGDAPAFEIFFAFAKNGKMAVPGGGFNAMPCISAEDVGEITAQTALRSDLRGERIKLTGPKAYNFPQVAAEIALATKKPVKHIAIPLTIVNVVSILIYPINPFFRFLYKSLLMLNNFPVDLAENVPIEHQKLRLLFDYEPVTLQMEIAARIENNRL